MFFGDEGKGALIDALARRYPVRAVIRFNGGAQAGHNVIHEGMHHTFSQFASASFLPHIKTYFSHHCLIDPLSASNEAEILSRKLQHNPLKRLYISEDSIIVTPVHRVMNLAREALRSQKHGSCGLGIGEAYLDSISNHFPVLRFRDLYDKELTRKKLYILRIMKRDALQTLSPDTTIDISEYMKDLSLPLEDYTVDKFYNFASSVNCITKDELQNLIREEEMVLFEGAQGALLDKDKGFFPHVTPSTTTADNAIELIKESDRSYRVFGAMRWYITRHGQGPLVSETDSFHFAESHNSSESIQGKFRFGLPDQVLFQYA